MREGPIAPTFLLAGWLFADLLLALAVMFTAAGGFGASFGGPGTLAGPTNVGVAAPTIVSAPEATLTTTPTPSSVATATPAPTAASVMSPPTPIPTPKPTAVHLESFCVRLDLPTLIADRPSPDQLDSARTTILSALAPLEDRHVSLVLTFGTSPREREAERLARNVNDILAELPAFTTPKKRRGELMRDYINLSNTDRGTVWIEVWVSSELSQIRGDNPKCP